MFRSGIDAQHPGRAGYKKSARGRGERFWELDFARGVCVILMVFDHFMYCLWDVMPVINDVLGTRLFDDLRPFAMTAPEMTDEGGAPLTEPRTPQMTFHMKLPRPVPAFSLVRRSVDLSAKSGENEER